MSVNHTKLQVNVDNFATDYSTENTLSNVLTKVNTLSTDTNSVYATETTLNTISNDLSNLQSKLPKTFSNNDIFTLNMRYGNFSSSGYYFKPIDFSGAFDELGSSNKIGLSSSDSSDTNIKFYLEGIGSDGSKQSEYITTDATNAQSKVSSVNTYLSITDFHLAQLVSISGNIYIYNGGVYNPSNGVPPEAIGVIVSSSRSNRAWIAGFNCPSDKKLIIHNIHLKKLGGSSNHKISLVRLFRNGWLYDINRDKGVKIDEWLVDGNIDSNFVNGWVINNTTDGLDQHFMFEAEATSADTDAIIDCKMTFSFL